MPTTLILAEFWHVSTLSEKFWHVHFRHSRGILGLVSMHHSNSSYKQKPSNRLGLWYGVETSPFQTWMGYHWHGTISLQFVTLNSSYHLPLSWPPTGSKQYWVDLVWPPMQYRMAWNFPACGPKYRLSEIWTPQQVLRARPRGEQKKGGIFFELVLLCFALNP